MTTYLDKNMRVSYHNQQSFGSGDCNIESFWAQQELPKTPIILKTAFTWSYLKKKKEKKKIS